MKALQPPATTEKDKPMLSKPKSEFLRVMIDRGFMQDCTDLEGLDDALTAGVVPGYIGFDATADSLHIGSLVQIMILRWLQKTGHRPIVLMGGGTSKIGDPSGRDEARQLLDTAAIDKNIEGIFKVFNQYLDFTPETGAIRENNATWLDELKYIAFLRDYGQHFTINRMLSFESVKLRLNREQPLTFLEFNYMLLQAYDFQELYKRHGCLLQMGGSDQWGNIVNGIDLSRRIAGAQVFGLTTPLITKADGSKMGKSAQGAIWLNADKLAPYEFWQYWRNTADADVHRFLKLFTELPLEDCARLAALEGAEINEAKIVLANEITRLAHGAEAASAAAATAREVFEAGGVGDDLPTITLSAADLGDGMSLAQLFVRAGLAASGKEAKRLVAESGARLNDELQTDAGRMITATDLAEPLKLSAGKKRHALARLT
tara:strand:- start:326 stop:1618 length:1293 start_codon:yes stop_codon:yes gene_type:complete